MQKILFTAALFSLAFCVHAQVVQTPQDRSAQHRSRILQRPVNEAFFNGYVIVIQQAIAGAYGYDISKGGQIVFSQRKNPFNNSPVGLRSKDDVFKIARWQISRVGADPHAAALFQLHLPKSVARNLNIRIQ